MIISKTPFRVSFVGGGTDIKDYYLKRNYGAVISTTINKYMYIAVNKGFDSKIRISYSKTEIVDSVDDIKHPIVRECLKMLKIDGGIEITSIADIPARTGLASSSAFTVGLLKALYAYKGIYISDEVLAQKACEIEIDILKEPIGKQDQYAVAYGGFNYIQFNSDESVILEPIICKKDLIKKLEQNSILFYTGINRSASDILTEQKKEVVDKLTYLDRLRDMTDEFRTCLSSEGNLYCIAQLLDKSWNLKKSINNKMTNDRIDRNYKIALNNGAIGGKILGAGGGGFFLFYCNKENQKQLIDSLSDLKYIPFEFENMGSRIIFLE